MKQKTENRKSTYVSSSSETAIEIGRQIDPGKTIFLARHMPTLMEMKKESLR